MPVVRISTVTCRARSQRRSCCSRSRRRRPHRVVVVAGITGQSAELSAGAAAGVDRLQSWLRSAGVDSSSASGAASTVKSAAPQIISTLVHGIVHGITRAGVGPVRDCRSPRSGRSSCSRTGPDARWLTAHRAARPGRAHDHGRGDHLAAPVLPRGHVRRRLQRRRRRARRADPRRAAGRDDRRRHVRRRVRPVHRRVGRRRVRGRARARRAGRRPRSSMPSSSCSRTACSSRSSSRSRIGATLEPQPARRARRDDRRRLPVRDVGLILAAPLVSAAVRVAKALDRPPEASCRGAGTPEAGKATS